MARFPLDENVSATIAARLRALGHDVATAGDLGLLGADDEVHLLAAEKTDRILVTHNRDDFRLLHRAWRLWARDWGVRRSHAGVLVIPQAPHWSPQHAATEVDLISRLPLRDELYTYDWQGSRGWQQEPVP